MRPARLPRGTMRRVWMATVVVACAAAGPGCGGGAGTGGPEPTRLPPQVTAISPDAGTTSGNTAVTITGANFRSGAVVTIAGVEASGVTVVSSGTITARTGARAAGTGDVVVTEEGMSGSLAAGFTYAVPGPTANPAPAITDLVAKGSRTNEPEGFADLGETIAISATVTDAETSPDALVYQWAASAGTLAGRGTRVAWTAPSQAATPIDAQVTLTVIERFITNDTATPAIVENTSTKSVVISLHDSAKEVGDMATRFLVNFSQSSVPVDTVMQDFLAGCYGTDAERQQVASNRVVYAITSWTVSPTPTVTVGFGGACTYDAHRGDACSYSDVEWHSTKLSSHTDEAVAGIDQVAAMYRGNRWWLCDSRFIGQRITPTSNGFLQLLSR